MDDHIPDTLNKAWKNDKSGFGYKMLQRMGWSEDKGLGKNEDGITVNLKVSKRENGLGLGSEGLDGAGNRGWSETATSFNEVLNVLKSTYSNDIKKTKKVKEKKKSKTNVIIPVGMKYKKMQAAKDFSTKSDKEKKAILGAALVNKSTDNNDTNDTDENDDKKHKKKSKKQKKDKKDKKDNENDNDNDNIIDWNITRPRTRSMSSVSNTDEKETDNKRKATHDEIDNDKEKKKKKKSKKE